MADSQANLEGRCLINERDIELIPIKQLDLFGYDGFDLIEPCEHLVVSYLGKQDNFKGGYITLGNCHECNSTISIDGYTKFRHGVYYKKFGLNR